MAWTKVELSCPICGYTRMSTNPSHPYCISCAKYRRAWTDAGVKGLLLLAKHETISIEEREEFVSRYHPSHVVTAESMSALRYSLRAAGFSGKYIRVLMDGITQTAHRHYKEAHPLSVCCVCGKTDGLEVHHIVPTSWGGPLTDEGNMEYRCQACHKKEHRRIASIIRKQCGGAGRLRNRWLAERVGEFKKLIGRQEASSQSKEGLPV